MNNNKQYKIALVLYTHGLDYDDRIRKEMLSVMKLYSNVSFKIFAIEPKNREEEGVTSYGVPYRIPYLKTRDKYPSSSHTLAKALDFYKSVKNDLRAFDALWCADIETFPFILLSTGKPILWDHHELPLLFMGNPLKKALFKFMEKKVKVMVHANKPRLDYLKHNGLVKHPQKQFVLRNYPDFDEIDSEYDELYHSFVQWKGDEMCAYLQGLTGSDRADVESVNSVLAVPGLKGVIVGSTRKELIDELLSKHSKEKIEKRLFFTGRIKQLKTPQYIRKCSLALIFYKHTSPNNWYCEPNRLFQSIINGTPVVVGNNPTMKELVEGYNVGECVNTDGSEVEIIVIAIKKLIENRDFFKQNLEKSNKKWLWASQEDTIRSMVDTLFLK